MKTEIQIRQAIDAAKLCADSVTGDAEQFFYVGAYRSLAWALELSDSAKIDEMIEYVRERKQRIAERN